MSRTALPIALVLLIAVLLVAACTDTPATPSSAGFPIDIQTQDPLAVSVTLVTVSVLTWRNDLESPLAIGQAVDSLGRFHTTDSLTSGTLPDSVRIHIAADVCSGLRDHDTVLTSPLHPAGLAVTVRLPQIDPAATVSLGESCGVGTGNFGGSAVHFWVALAIDSITDSIRGRWDLSYQESRATEGGAFAGDTAGGTLTLDLRSTVPSGCQPHYTLVGAVGPANIIGPAHLQDIGGCPTYYEPFQLVAFDVPWLP